MSEKRRICLVIPSLNAGGMERVMSELANYFCSRPELEVHLIMYGIKPELFYSIPSNLIIHKPNFKFNNKLRFWFSVKTLFFIRKKIKSINPDSVLSFGELWNNFVLIALLGLKFPVFVSDRCQPDKSLGRFHDTLRKYLYPKAKGVIVQTAKASEFYHNLIPKANIHVIGNPIKSISKKNNTIKENIILSVGRLIKTKHHDRLIRIFLNLNAPDWKLIILGGDALKQNNSERLEKLISAHNAQNRIFLKGSTKNVDDYYQKSKIFAFTSSSEGFPNVIGEALSACLPVVAYDCIAGPSEMIDDGVNGYLVPVFDDEIFQKRLQSLINSDNLSNIMGLNGSKSVEKFSVEIIGKQFFDLILK